MGVHTISHVIPFLPVKLSAATPANALVPTVSFEELDRQARGGISQRSIEESQHPGPRLRRRSSDFIDEGRDRRRRVGPRGAANDRPEGPRRRGTGEFGIHLAASPFPERVQHSSPFVAQLIGQQFGDGEESGALDEGLAAYDGAVALSQSFFGAYAPVELVA